MAWLLVLWITVMPLLTSPDRPVVAVIEYTLDPSGQIFYTIKADPAVFYDPCHLMAYTAAEGRLACGDEIFFGYLEQFQMFDTLTKDQRKY
jgi:hypothetical protein